MILVVVLASALAALPPDQAARLAEGALSGLIAVAILKVLDESDKDG